MGGHVTVLGSGSAGNCTLIESATTRILIDAGLSGRQINERLAALGRSIDQVDGILLTHEHCDHTRGLARVCKQKHLPVFANRLTAEAVAGETLVGPKPAISWRLFATGASFEIGDLHIDTFSVPHDAYDPVGFVVRHATWSVGVITDLGHPTKLVIERVRDTDILVVEANHDVKMLQNDTARPWATKQRIMSRHGHLSNDAAAELTGDALGDRMRHVFLAHLSRDCNRPDLAQEVVHTRLQKLGARSVQIHVATQEKPTATVGVGGQ